MHPSTSSIGAFAGVCGPCCVCIHITGIAVRCNSCLGRIRPHQHRSLLMLGQIRGVGSTAGTANYKRHLAAPSHCHMKQSPPAWRQMRAPRGARPSWAPTRCMSPQPLTTSLHPVHTHRACLLPWRCFQPLRLRPCNTHREPSFRLYTSTHCPQSSLMRTEAISTTTHQSAAALPGIATLAE